MNKIIISTIAWFKYWSFRSGAAAVGHGIIEIHFTTPNVKHDFVGFQFNIASCEQKITDFQPVTPSGELNIGICGLKCGEIAMPLGKTGVSPKGKMKYKQTDSTTKANYLN